MAIPLRAFAIFAFAIFALALALSLLSLQAGVVQTPSARFEGKILLEKDAVAVDDRKVAWADVLYLLPDSRPVAGGGQRVHLKNGESWVAEIVSLTDGKLEVRSDLFGVKKLDLALVAGLEFISHPMPETSRAIGTLYRVKGEAVPGKLLAIKADKVTIDSAVGELELPRLGLISFRFAAAKAVVGPGDDEVALVDGGRFHGKLSLEAEGAKLDHPSLGAINLPVAMVRSVVRHPAQMLDLIGLPPRSIQSTPVLPAAKSAALHFVRSAVWMPCASTFIKGLLFEPKSVIVYKLPGQDGTGASCAAC